MAAWGAALIQRSQLRSGVAPRRLGRAVVVLGPPLTGPVGPAVNLAYRADRSGLSPFTRQPEPFPAWPLLPIWVTRPVSRATRVDSIEWAIGFST